MTKKEALVKAVQDAGGLATLKIGSLLQIYSRDIEDEVLGKVRTQAMRTGEAIELNGTLEFYRWDEIEIGGMTGSARYVWDADGNRVKSEFVKIFVDRDGKRERTVLKTAFRKFE